MGQRGFAPAPVALKILKGETRPSRLQKSPVSGVEPPLKPADLKPDAAEVWDATLAVADHISKRDAQTFRTFCETAATANAMQPKGSKEWREVVLVNLRCARELCLTPATGAHLGHAATPERKLDKYLAV